MRGSIPPLPQYVSTAWCSAKKKKKHRDNFNFTAYFLSISLSLGKNFMDSLLPYRVTQINGKSSGRLVYPEIRSSS
jgi:hypothetical protein